jgi:uncharacterized membrane protein (UPF0136 family)
MVDCFPSADPELSGFADGGFYIIMILWVYIAMLIAGGMVGFIKAGSKASIIASTVLAVPLVAVNLGYLPLQVAWVVIGMVAAIFAVRFAKTRKPMPAIPMLVASAVVLTLLIVRGR